jgi:hypothetical protein
VLLYNRLTEGKSPAARCEGNIAQKRETGGSEGERAGEDLHGRGWRPIDSARYRATLFGMKKGLQAVA